MAKKTNCYNPKYYLYQRDGQWFITNENDTKEITTALHAHQALKIPNAVLYPQYDKPDNTGERVLAWRVNERGEMVVRNAWRVCEHSRGHTNCVILGDGQCLVKVACELEWSEKYQRWILAEMVGLATEHDLLRAGIK